MFNLHWRRSTRRLLAASAALLAVTSLPFGSAAAARGPAPYLPLNLSPVVERRIEQLLILAGKPVMTRPISAAAVQEALDTACELETVLCREVRAYLQVYTRGAAVTDLGASIFAADTDAELAAINQRGAAFDSAWSGFGRAFLQPSDYLLVNVGATLHDDGGSASGTLLSTGIEFAQIDVGYRDHWFSPFTDSAMIVSTQAEPRPSITLSNYTPLSRLKFRYEVFFSDLSHSDRIAHEGGLTSGNPKASGVHLELEPFPGYAIAVNRVLQFGGGARGGASFKDFFEALYRTGQVDNSGGDPDDEFGNQIASITARMLYPGPTPIAVYLEYAGEDRSYAGRRRLGNSALSLGIDLPTLFDRLDLTYEVSDWQNAWYVHHLYGDGLASGGNVIGHWGGDWRVPGDGVGAQSHMLRIGRQTAGGYSQIRYRTLENERYSGVNYERAHDLELEHYRPWRNHLVGLELELGRDVFGDRFGRLGASLHVDDEWAVHPIANGETRDEERGFELFADFGAVTGDYEFFSEEDAAGNQLWTRSDFGREPHFGIGVRRNVSERSSFGARIEWDLLADQELVSVRALDYRRRLTARFAVSGFAGAARYDLATPAYGYYLGIGAQVIDVLPRVDVSIDLRHHDKVARDKLLPSDPPFTTRNDMFFDLFSVAAYLSYKF